MADAVRDFLAERLYTFQRCGHFIHGFTPSAAYRLSSLVSISRSSELGHLLMGPHAQPLLSIPRQAENIGGLKGGKTSGLAGSQILNVISMEYNLTFR